MTEHLTGIPATSPAGGQARGLAVAPVKGRARR